MTMRQDIEENKQTEQEPYEGLSETIKEKLSWFEDQKIGVIFHWGLYSQAGIVESWQLSEEDEWARKKPWREDLATLRKEYWALNEQFNPTLFCPDEWAEKCKKAGFRYMLFTTKHHDGFSMYDTKESTFKMTSDRCPFHLNEKADVFQAIMKSFQKAGIATGAYYSKADWHCPYYWVPGEHARGRYASYDPLENPQMWQKFEDFVENQLLEICSNYGPVDILWLDAGWVNARNEQLNMPKIIGKLRQHQPTMLVVDRTIGGEFENYVTPERKIPEIAPEKVWESNIPLANNWGYVPNDVYKPFSTILESILKIVSMGGNVILGIGPKPDGTLPKEAEAIMAQLGDFLTTYGEGIYESRAIPELSIDNWYFTKKEQVIYGFSLASQEKPAILNISALKAVCSIAKIEDLKTGVLLEITDDRLSLLSSGQVIGIKIYENEICL